MSNPQNDARGADAARNWNIAPPEKLRDDLDAKTWRRWRDDL
jgi:hypothetical protein